jgi:hypothetical protein
VTKERLGSPNERAAKDSEKKVDTCERLMEDSEE